MVIRQMLARMIASLKELDAKAVSVLLSPMLTKSNPARNGKSLGLSRNLIALLITLTINNTIRFLCWLTGASMSTEFYFAVFFVLVIGLFIADKREIEDYRVLIANMKSDGIFFRYQRIVLAGLVGMIVVCFLLYYLDYEPYK